MKRLFCWLYLGVFVVLVVACGSKPLSYNYEAVCGGVGSGGSYLVKISTFGKNVEKAKEKSRSHAVHAVLFKGIEGGDGCQSQQPLCNVSYNDRKAWFDDFFKSEDYLQYVSFTNSGYVDASDRLKTSDGSYKVGVLVSVKADLLRSRMEKEGFSRSLSQGF